MSSSCYVETVQVTSQTLSIPPSTLKHFCTVTTALIDVVIVIKSAESITILILERVSCISYQKYIESLFFNHNIANYRDILGR
jgi:hypothetical protein